MTTTAPAAIDTAPALAPPVPAALGGPAERLAGLAERYRGRLHDVQGFGMYLSPDEWIQRKLIEDGVHEWAETAILPTFVRRGQTVLDVGANIGYYSLLLSRLVGPRGRVVAFEPNPVVSAKLREHVALNAAANVEVAELALGEDSREGRFLFDPAAGAGADGVANFGGWSLAHQGAADAARANVTVAFSTLDRCVEERGLGRVHFVKIDVEGLELAVLRGAGRVLAEHRPSWLIEFQADRPEGTARLGEIRDLLRSRRYTLCRIHKKPWPHLRELAEADLAAPAHFYVLAYPGRHPIHP